MQTHLSDIHVVVYLICVSSSALELEDLFFFLTLRDPMLNRLPIWSSPRFDEIPLTKAGIFAGRWPLVPLWLASLLQLMMAKKEQKTALSSVKDCKSKWSPNGKVGKQ